MLSNRLSFILALVIGLVGCNEKPLYSISFDSNKPFTVENETIICGANLIDTVHSRVAANQNDLEIWCRNKTKPILSELNFKPIDKPESQWQDSTIANINGLLFEQKSSTFLQDGKWIDSSIIFNFNGRVLWYQNKNNGFLAITRDSCGNSIRSDRGYHGTINGEYSAFYFTDNKLLANIDLALYEIDYPDIPIKKQCHYLSTRKLSDDKTWAYGMKPFLNGIIIGGTKKQGLNSVIHFFNNGEMENITVDLNNIIVSEYYSYLQEGDNLLIGVYPSGHLIKLSPHLVTSLIKIPFLTKEEPSITLIDHIPYPQREAQSMTLLKGTLLVGMYPWGILYAQNGDTWSHKPIIPKLIGTGKAIPFEIERKENAHTRKHGLSWRSWGFRITSLAVFNGKLCLGTGSMDGNASYDSNVHTHIPEKIGDAYGKIYCSDVPNHLLISSPEKPRISFYKNKIIVENNGKKIKKKLSEPILSPLI